MHRFRRIPPLFVVALTAVATAVAAGPALATSEPDDEFGSSGSETTDSETTDSETTDSETTDSSSEPDGGAGVETDPARLDWLEFAEDADPDTFAGGADLADLVDGNRVLMIGDSVMASTASRYGGEMCDSVGEAGWDVEVDAETGRFIDFGQKVLDERLQDGFDVAVVMLGNNYGANPDVYEEYLRDIVEDLEPRPIVLLTVSVFQPNRVEVNDVIYEIAQEHDNVRVLDWAGETEANPALTGGDGLHLTDLGRARFADMVAEELGDAPGFGDGECLSSSFTDDSAGTGNTGPIEGQVTMPPNTWPSTPQPTTPPSTDPPAPETTAGGGGDTTVPPVTEPPVTEPPATEPPATQPPATQPPATEPPATQPPATDPPPPGTGG